MRFCHIYAHKGALFSLNLFSRGTGTAAIVAARNARTLRLLR